MSGLKFQEVKPQLPNSINYNVFLLRGNTTDNAKFLFSFRQSPKLRPSVGDVLTNPLTFSQFKILKDEVPLPEATIIRFTDNNDRRVTDNGDIRVIQEGVEDLDTVTHNYFVTPANNPNRISSYSTAGFANDQTLKQLFR